MDTNTASVLVVVALCAALLLVAGIIALADRSGSGSGSGSGRTLWQRRCLAENHELGRCIRAFDHPQAHESRSGIEWYPGDVRHMGEAEFAARYRHGRRWWRRLVP
jgi:hypothetical protein